MVNIGKSPNIQGLTEEKFLERVYFEPNTGCWLHEARQESGYAYIMCNGKFRGAHRVSWALFRGPIPDGLEVDHTCNVRCCVNPDHLEPKPWLENRKRIRRTPPYQRREGRGGVPF